MRIRFRKGSWILFVLAIVGFAFPSVIAATAAQESNGPILATFYDNFGYNGSPPLPDESGRPIVGTTSYFQINQYFDSEPMFGLYEDFIVKYEGHISSPVTGEVYFWPWADDGTKLIIDSQLVDDNWVDKGGGGNISQPVSFVKGQSKPFVYWFYENGGGAWTSLYWNIGNGWELVPSSAFSQVPITTTTTIPKILGRPTNVTLTDIGTAIKVNWNAAEDNTNISPERYAISWSTNNSGWGVSTGNVGDLNSLNTEIILPYSLFSSTGGLDAEYLITVRADNDTQSVYSQQSEPVLLKIGTTPPPPTTTTTTTTTAPTTTTTTTTTTVASDQPIIVLGSSTTTIPVTTTTNFIQGTSTVPTTTTLLATTTVAPTTSSTTTTPTTTTIPVVKEEISPEQAVNIATSPEVLQNISKDDAQKVFESIDTSKITEEQKTEIINAVQNAPQEVKEAFEGEINVYAEGFDDYVPVGSNIDVGARRTLLAATTVLASSTVLGASGSPSNSGGSGPSGTGGGSNSGQSSNSYAKREDNETEEEEEEESVEIEGPEGDEEENNFTKNSIYKYTEGTMEKRFSPFGFIKKFARETAALAFTISGTVIVFATLSGETRKITIIATSIAFAVHYLNAMLKNDE